VSCAVSLERNSSPANSICRDPPGQSGARLYLSVYQRRGIRLRVEPFSDHARSVRVGALWRHFSWIVAQVCFLERYCATVATPRLARLQFVCRTPKLNCADIGYRRPEMVDLRDDGPIRMGVPTDASAHHPTVGHMGARLLSHARRPTHHLSVAIERRSEYRSVRSALSKVTTLSVRPCSTAVEMTEVSARSGSPCSESGSPVSRQAQSGRSKSASASVDVVRQRNCRSRSLCRLSHMPKVLTRKPLPQGEGLEPSSYAIAADSTHAEVTREFAEV